MSMAIMAFQLLQSFTRVYAQTHVFKMSVCKGLQWVILNATHEYDVVYEGSLVFKVSV